MSMNQKTLDQVRCFFEEGIPFNKFLGLTVRELEPGRAVVSIPFRPEYVGDSKKGIVHGGIISTLIDLTGGATAFTVLEPPRETSLNTIDMRVDYMRMGRGKEFIATGSVLRKGNRICVVRIEVVNDEDMLIAHGTAAYNIFTGNVAGLWNPTKD